MTGQPSTSRYVGTLVAGIAILGLVFLIALVL